VTYCDSVAILGSLGDLSLGLRLSEGIGASGQAAACTLLRPSSRKCCSGLRAWNTDQCLQVLDFGCPVTCGKKMQKALIGINSLYLWKNISRLSDLQGGQSGGRAVTSICDLDCMSFPHDSLSNTKSESCSFLVVLVAPKLITSFAPVQVRLEGGLGLSLSKKDTGTLPLDPCRIGGCQIRGAPIWSNFHPFSRPLTVR
jgi:hypothetical protein